MRRDLEDESGSLARHAGPFHHHHLRLQMASVSFMQLAVEAVELALGDRACAACLDLVWF